MTDSSDSDLSKNDDTALLSEVKTYRRRWWVLLLFSLYSATNAFQWIQYSIISNIIVKFYDVSNSAADWLSIIFMLAYIPLIFPATWLLDYYGLRLIGLLGAGLNAAGAIVKIFSCDPSLFGVTMTGQTIAAVSQVFILGMPSKLAATWFGPAEVSTACSLAVFGNQFGTALGFLLPPIIVVDSDDKSVVQNDLRLLFIITAVTTSFLFVLVIFTFKNQPKYPPSVAQAKYRQMTQKDGKNGSEGNVSENVSYGSSLKALLVDVPSVLLIVSYGINTGTYYAISTLLNDEILDSFPDSLKEAGQVGLTLVLLGIAGSVLCGVVLDKTKAYRKTTVLVYALTLVSMGLYSGLLKSGALWTVYVAGGLLGFTMTGYLPVGFEFAAEITYPVCEGISSGMLNASAQAFGIGLTIFTRFIMTHNSVLIANICLCGLLFVGTILTIATKEDLKRQKANENFTSIIKQTSFHSRNDIS